MIRRAWACAALALSLAAYAADPVAFVADLKGSATIEGDGRLVFLAELAPGTRLLLGTGATVAVTYAVSGTEFTISGPGEFLVGADAVQAEKGAAPQRRAVTTLRDMGAVARVSRAATASLRMRGLSPDAAATKSALEFPVNTRIASLRPTLRWREAGGEATVRVVDDGGREVWKGSAKATTARTGVKLAPATRYTWTVMTPRGIVGEAHFETLSAEALGRVEKSRALARSFSERVMHAVLLQELGAAQEAREAWAALASERPDLPELAVLATAQ